MSSRGGGALFDAFSNAGRRLKIGEELDAKIDKAFKAYMANPGDPKLLQELEDLEDLVAQGSDYTTADGDTGILKALDHHNDLDEGLQIFDLCRRGAATQTFQPLIKTIKPLHTIDY